MLNKLFPFSSAHKHCTHGGYSTSTGLKLLIMKEALPHSNERKYKLKNFSAERVLFIMGILLFTVEGRRRDLNLHANEELFETLIF